MGNRWYVAEFPPCVKTSPGLAANKLGRVGASQDCTDGLYSCMVYLGLLVLGHNINKHQNLKSVEYGQTPNQRVDIDCVNGTHCYTCNTL